MNPDRHHIEGIAIIGISGRFPGAQNIDEFWDNLVDGKESISTFTDEECLASGVPDDLLKNPNFVKRGGVLDNIDLFDAAFFGYSPVEAIHIDPQQRIFLECAEEALENAGYCPGAYDGAIGVYAGCGINNYLLKNLLSTDPLMEQVITPLIFFGNDKDFLTTRVSYKLNLTGPSITVQTACSTSLTAIQLACQGLLTYQCDMALSGGVSLQAPRMKGYLYKEGQILSSDGYCRAFDKNATGTVLGEGVGILVLKRIEDAIADRDTIYAVIRGIAANNDGSEKAGFTAPSIEGQASVITLTQGIADVEPDDITYIETHGTGTPLGDPIEVSALNQAFNLSTIRKGFCAIGSVKPNIGHLDTAAGVASMIKTALSIKNAVIPPSINFTKANPELQLETTPFFVNNKLKEWETNGKPRIAGVSSFGIGGTNVHAVLSEPPPVDTSISRVPSHLLLLSAKTETALNKASVNLRSHFSRNPEINLSDAAYTLMIGRNHYSHRSFVVCSGAEDATRQLDSLEIRSSSKINPETVHRPIIFMFSGQGTQYPQMARELYEYLPVFRQELDRCAEALIPPMGFDLRKIIYPDNSDLEPATVQLNETSNTQPALFAIEYACAKSLMGCGIIPDVMIGHSIGEYVAACISGVFSLEDALGLIATRGRLVQNQDRGSMLAIQLPEEKVRPFVNEELTLAAVNSPQQCVVSGSTGAIESLQEKLASFANAGNKILFTKLRTSHAFHSLMMEPAAERLIEAVSRCQLDKPRIPFISNVTGNYITDSQATDPGYWGQHLTHTVRFSDGLKSIINKSHPLIIEIGPGMVLSSFARNHLEKPDDALVLSTIPHRSHKISDYAVMLKTLGDIWSDGFVIDWQALYRNEARMRIPLPSYPFDRKRFWVDYRKKETANRLNNAETIISSGGSDSFAQESYEPISPIKTATTNSAEAKLLHIWKSVLGYKDIDIEDNYFELGGSSLMAVSLFNKIEKMFDIRLPLATLYDAPTIKGLAAILQSSDYIPVWNSLVTINKGNANKPPFFCVHAEGGNVLEYRLLSKYLGEDQPFYGIQAKGLQGDKIIEESIEDMAASYIKELRTVQKHGPYLIGGYCLGGLVAYEISQQLIRAGENIALLVLISTGSPVQARWIKPNLTPIKRFFYRMLERVELEWDNFSHLNWTGKKHHAIDRALRLLSDIQSGFEKKLDRLFNLFGIEYKWHSRAYILKESVEHTNVAYVRYESKPISCPIHLFQVSRPLFERELIWDEYWGWKDYAENGIQLYPVVGFHKNVLKEPYVASLSEKIKSLIIKSV